MSELLAAASTAYQVELFTAYESVIDEPPRRRALDKYFTGIIHPDDWRGWEMALLSSTPAATLIEFWHLAEGLMPVVRRICPWTSVIVDSVDVHFVREEAAASLGLMSLERVRENGIRELAAYAAADAVVVITPEDATQLRSKGLSKPIYVIPNIYPKYHRPIAERPPLLLFVGGFAHLPNADGLHWFIKTCWREIRSQVPKATLSIVGSNTPSDIAELDGVDGVSVVGYVPDTTTYLEQAAVSIAPLRFGSGMKGKVCEALAAAVPVVTTSVGIQGLPIVDWRGARVQNEPAGFAEAVVWSLNNRKEAAQMASHGQTIIESICGRLVVRDEILRMLREMSRRPTPTQQRAWLARGLHLRSLVIGRRCATACGLRALKRFLSGRVSSVSG